MTVMSLFTPCPRIKRQAFCPFGIFPFLMISSVPDTSVTLLMKNATSILVSVFTEMISPRQRDVNRFSIMFHPLTFPIFYGKLNVLESVNGRIAFALFLRSFGYAVSRSALPYETRHFYRK
jgi:hypothetical protein